MVSFMKFKKGDTVKLISGNDKGKQGKILAVLPAKGMMVVDGLNLKKKHMKPRAQGKKGEMVRFPAPVPQSRAMLVCPSCAMAARVGMRTDDAGKKARVCKRCGKEIR